MRHSTKLLRASPEIKAFIKTFEELKLEAYLDQGKVPTIGWGHTSGVKIGMVITRTQAEDWFRADVAVAEGVLRLAVKTGLHQWEFDALVSLIFNIGGGKFASSTMRTRLNQGLYEQAGHQFMRWIHVKGKVSKGLERRRLQEERIFTTGQFGH